MKAVTKGTELVASVGVLVILSVTQTTAVGAASNPQGPVAVADPQPPGGVPGVEVPVIAWSEAGDGYQQARIAVPSDYAHPEGPKFHLNAVRLPASDPEKRLGSIFFNFGGPGEGAAASVREGGKFILPPEVLARYDVIGVDPRGTGRSQPVRCLSGIKAQQNLPYAMGATFPTNARERVIAYRQAHRYARECHARNSDLLNHVGTLPFARDLDVIRAAMCDDENQPGRNVLRHPSCAGRREHVPHSNRRHRVGRCGEPKLGGREARQHQLADRPASRR